MAEGQAFCQSLLSTWFCGRGSVCHHESEIEVGGELAEFCGEAEFLPYRFTCGGAAVCVWAGGEGEISHADADAGEIYRLPGGVLLSDVQSLPPLARSPADGGGWAYG